MKKIIISCALALAAFSVSADVIQTDSTSNSTTNSTSKSETTVKSPPPSAVAPAITSMNNDLCAVGVSGAAQTQILGIAIGSTFVDKNCERLKLSKNLYDMGMKVAAVATLCQDERVFTAMLNAGTPCPVEGKIGADARAIWDERGVRPESNQKENVGFYSIPNPPKREEKVVEKKASLPGCGDYKGDDPVIRERIGCASAAIVTPVR